MRKAVQVIEHATDRSGHVFYSLFLPSLENWPIDLCLPSKNFILLLASDSREVPDSALKSIASRAIDQGAVYICAWGPGCDRMEFSFDLAVVDLGGESDDAVIMTTSHADESLDDALWFFAFVAWPTGFEATANTYLAVVVGDHDCYAQVCRRLDNLSGINEDMTREES